MTEQLYTADFSDVFYIDDLTSKDKHNLLEVINSTEYPFFDREGQSAKEAADKLILLVERAAVARSRDQFKAIRTESGRLIGCVVLVNFDEQGYGEAEIGYFIHKNFQRRGIMTEAVFKVIQSAVKNSDLKTLHSTVHPQNIASRKILAKLGFTEGRLIETSTYVEQDGSPSPRIVVTATQQAIDNALKHHPLPMHPTFVPGQNFLGNQI